MFDRNSADLRMFSLVRLLSGQGIDCTYYACNIPSQERSIGETETRKYRLALEDLGVQVMERVGFEGILASSQYGAVYFKYFYPAENRIQYVRLWQPKAKIIVDSVDLVYLRLFAKAATSNSAEVFAEADRVRNRELRTYHDSDMVIAITEEEALELRSQLPNLSLVTIPNVHEIPENRRVESEHPTILFIGVFTHEPNVDAVLYFVHDVWQLITAEVPDARLTIVGGKPTQDILSLASDKVEVTGYVPETLPYLQRSWVSIAPLRFGAGMKGKVGEAMAACVPVVTTSFGAQGFGLEPGTHLLVGDDAESFARHVINLLKDSTLRTTIGNNGRKFIDERYSPGAVNELLSQLICSLKSIQVKEIPFRRLRLAAAKGRRFVDSYFMWRLKGKS